MPTMSVEHCEERCLLDSWSQWFIWLGARLLQIKDDGYPIFIVISRRSIMSIGCVRKYRSLSLVRYFTRLDLRNDLSERPDTVVSNGWGSDV